MPTQPQAPAADPIAPAPLSKLRVRWAFDNRSWSPSEACLSSLIATFPSEDQEKCQRFLHVDDRKRAVASRLLQRCFGSLAFDKPREGIRIARTDRGKPFFVQEHPIAKSLNFNVSHEGDWVVLASDPEWLCGIDVAAPNQLRFAEHLPVMERMRMLHKFFSEHEYETAQSYAHDDAKLERFFRHLWSLKESFLKARGDGLQICLDRASFTLEALLPMSAESRIMGSTQRTAAAARSLSASPRVSAHVSIDGVPAPQWVFSITLLPGDHVVSTALAPAAESVDAIFRERAVRPPGRSAPRSGDAVLPFRVLTISDLT
eukprot:jgi/Ulvmu1/593/UM001_0601.1